MWLLPRAGPTVTVVATADLHRHHEDRYIDHDSKNLAEWFASDAPAHVDVALFAGDLGLELSSELSGRSRGTDRPATGAREMPREQDAHTVAMWNRLLRAMLAARPSMQVVLVAGNHDGLLCEDDGCLACLHLRRCAGADAWGSTPRAAAAETRRRLLSGVDMRRVHVLCDSFVDLRLRNGWLLRVVGSPWTSYDVLGKEHLSHSHHWRPQGGLLFGGASLQLPEQRTVDWGGWWEAHWARIGAMLEGGPHDASLLVTHTPPHGVLDIVGGAAGAHAKGYKGRVGCRALAEVLRGLRRPPVLHAFGHVHAVQARGEPPEGPRLCAAKHVEGTCFANVAAERQLPTLTGYRLARRAGERLGEARALAMPPLTEQEWTPDQRELLMRPPTLLVLPLNGHRCDAPGWHGWQREK